MAGLFGLFGKKTKYVDEITPDDRSSSEEAFFLKPDDAKTLGNVDYMRQSKVIKRTFPKQKNSQEKALIQQVSATEKTKVQDTGISMAKSESSENKAISPATSESSQRSQSDDSMDIFRKMARDIKK